MTRVLIIEDDTWLAEHYESVLVSAGYAVVLAHDAFTAIEKIDDDKPDVLVVDVLLPGNTIFALLNELQSHADLSGIPTIVVTNLADAMTLDDLKPYGVVRLLDKAKINPDDIVSAVKGATKDE
jgi:DNA-binding response OmpR family regulator